MTRHACLICRERVTTENGLIFYPNQSDGTALTVCDQDVLTLIAMISRLARDRASFKDTVHAHCAIGEDLSSAESI